jgi:hypothetical protein
MALNEFKHVGSFVPHRAADFDVTATLSRCSLSLNSPFRATAKLRVFGLRKEKIS